MLWHAFGFEEGQVAVPPSFRHEAFVYLFQNLPELAPLLLRMTKLLSLPPFTSVQIESIDFSEIVPTEYRVDAVAVLKEHDKPVLAVIIEVQLRKDDKKRLTWPFYQTSARAKFRCPSVVLVLAPQSSVARWAKKPILLGGSNVWTPVVLGADSVPVVTDPALSRKFPELAVLSVMAHGKGEPEQALRIAKAAFQGVEALSDEENRVLYSDLIDAHLGEAVRKAFAMIPEGYQYQSKFGNKRYAEGKAEGEASGLTKGKAEGEASGLAKGERRALFKILERRGITLSAIEQERVLSCQDLELLEIWLDRALTASSAEELFG